VVMFRRATNFWAGRRPAFIAGKTKEKKGSISGRSPAYPLFFAGIVFLFLLSPFLGCGQAPPSGRRWKPPSGGLFRRGSGADENPRLRHDSRRTPQEAEARAGEEFHPPRSARETALDETSKIGEIGGWPLLSPVGGLKRLRQNSSQQSKDIRIASARNFWLQHNSRDSAPRAPHPPPPRVSMLLRRCREDDRHHSRLRQPSSAEKEDALGEKPRRPCSTLSVGIQGHRSGGDSGVERIPNERLKTTQEFLRERLPATCAHMIR